MKRIESKFESPIIAMLGWPEILGILVILGVLIVGAAVVLFLVLRAATGGSQVQERIKRLEQEVQELRKTQVRDS